jgi:hypothetical protein
LDRTVLQDGVVALDCHCAGILVVSSVSRVVGESLVSRVLKLRISKPSSISVGGPMNLGSHKTAVAEPQALQWRPNT